MSVRLLILSAIALALLSSCSPSQFCYRDDDCDSEMICKADGECGFACVFDEDCEDGFECLMHACHAVSRGELSCPEGMVAIDNAYCMDVYEASKPDATATAEGVDESMATSRFGVMPWKIGNHNDKAQAACVAAGKRLCTANEWEFACRGANDTTYGYGDTYQPKTCNGIDTFGLSSFHLMTTGAFENCHNGWGVYDLSGNLWEHTADGSALTVRGGAYNCADSQNNHRCAYVPNTWTPLALGFRCCADGNSQSQTASENPHEIQPPNIDDDAFEL